MNRWWRHTSLRYQLALVVGAVLVVLLTSFSAALYLSLRQFLMQQAERQLRMASLATGPAMITIHGEPPIIDKLQFFSKPIQEQSSVIITEDTAAIPWNDPVKDQLHILANALTDSQMSAVIGSLDGSELARGVRASLVNVPAPPPLNRQALQNLTEQNQPEIYIGANGDERYLAMMVPIRDQTGLIIGGLQLATPLRTVDTVLQGFFWFLVLGTVATLILGMGLCVIASGRVLRPIHQIVDASREVANGNFTTRLRLPSGNEVGRLGDAFDHMVARTAEAFAAQQRFIADAAHELRTPLTAIGGSIEMLQIGAVDHQPEKRRRLLQSIGCEVDRLGRLANDLLLLSTLDQQPRGIREPCDLSLMLQDLVEQTQVVAPQHRVRAELPDALPVIGDGDQLRQVFLNILTNARTYTPTGGTITVTAVAGKRMTINITDTGIGIPTNELPHIWERLYRVERSRSRAAGGSGLGLAIVHKIVTAHGGEVSARSALNVGTTITVTLPGAV